MDEDRSTATEHLLQQGLAPLSDHMTFDREEEDIVPDDARAYGGMRTKRRSIVYHFH